MRSDLIKKFLSIALGFALIGISMPQSSADDNSSVNTFVNMINGDPGMSDEIYMVLGDVQAIPARGLTRVSVTDPEVADIADAQADKVSLLAKRAGSTVLFMWDSEGKHSIKVRVANEDLSALKTRLQKVLSEGGYAGVSLEVNWNEGKIVMTGNLSKEEKFQLNNILQPYSDNILNLIKEEHDEDLIQVDMQVVEISTTLEKNLGILWGTNTTNTSTDANGNTTTTSTNSNQVNLNYTENPPGGNSFADLFKIGSFQRTSPLEATVNALVQEGKARLISKPRLVVVSGKQASFLVGGEIPVETTTTNTTGTTLTQSTTYAQYGVNMTITPTIREGKVDVLLNVDIRDIDPANSSNGNTAFITRTASTDLFMDNKQTIALAGLVKYTDSKQITEVPFLSRIPILGALFRNVSTPSADTNTEMVIILTPTVLTDKKYASSQLAMPTPSEIDSWNEIDSKYKHEPLGSDWPPPKVATLENNLWEMDEVMNYARMVQLKISRVIFNYQQSSLEGQTGTVKLRLCILKDGELGSEEVTESSGSDTLDHDALQAAKIAAPFDAFTSGMDQEDLVFTIPIVYNQPSMKVVDQD